jgi:hypothetical protein
MIIDNLQDRQINDTVYIAGTPYVIKRIVSNTAYAQRQGTAGTKQYLIQPEGRYHTVSEIKGDRAQPWSHCGVLHFLKPVDIYPGLE